jgi:hypothetical protein
MNLASFNFTGLAGNEHIKSMAADTLRKYGLGSCGPPGFYGTFGATNVFMMSQKAEYHNCRGCSHGLGARYCRLPVC